MRDTSFKPQKLFYRWNQIRSHYEQYLNGKDLCVAALNF